MNLAVATHTPDAPSAPGLALLSGTLAERAVKARQYGFSGLELMVTRPAEVDARAVQEEVVGADLQIAAVASGPVAGLDRVTLLSNQEEVAREGLLRLRGLIELAGAWGATVVTIGSFRGQVGQDSDAPGKLADRLRLGGEWARAAGIRLALEPLNRYETDFLHTAQQALAFLQQVDHPQVGLLLDTFHMNIEEERIVHAVRLAAEAGRLFHIHLGENHRRAPGTGSIDFAGLVGALRALNYTGWLSAELLPLPTPDEAARETGAFMRSLLLDG